MPQALMILLRHERISTTMRYYVGRNNANSTPDAVWAAYLNGKTGTALGAVSRNDLQTRLRRRPQAMPQVLSPIRLCNSRGGTRTRTGVKAHRILNPVRLPIPPLGPRHESQI